MPPEKALEEVELAMVKTGSSGQHFKFKTCTPIYPTMEKKLTDPDYWNKLGWTYAGQMKQEKEKAHACEMVLYEFKHKRIYDKNEIRKHAKKLPTDFEETFDFLTKLVLRDKNFDHNRKIPGDLWVRELYMKG